jgi:hypothetical protein
MEHQRTRRRTLSPLARLRVNANVMQEKIDSVLRNRWVWCGLLLTTYLLPSLIADVPVALAMPWILIPHVYEGMYEFLRTCGMPSLTGAEPVDKVLLFAIVFHLIFWPLCCLLMCWGKRLSRIVLRVSAGVLLLILVITVHGCSIAIDAVRH